MPASELMNQGSHAPNTGRQAEANSGSVPMHAHVHDTTTDPPTVRRHDALRDALRYALRYDDTFFAFDPYVL
jgi:hypothetical protein